METVRKRLDKKVPVTIILISLAAIMIILGLYSRFQPERFIRNDIREYNVGVEQFNVGIEQYQLAAEKVAEDRVAYDVFFDDDSTVDNFIKGTFDSALVHFEEAIIESKDNKIKSLSFYNLGTIIGISAGDIRFRDDYRYEIEVAFDKLSEAIRHDPHNEDAKYNLELLESMYNIEKSGGVEDIIQRGYTPGILRKGF